MGHDALLVVARRASRGDVWNREGALHAGGARPTDVYAAFCGQLPVDWYFCEAKDPQAKGGVERLQEYLESNFEPGRSFADHLDFQLQMDTWFEKANMRTHKTLRARPIGRLAEEREVMRALSASIAARRAAPARERAPNAGPARPESGRRSARGPLGWLRDRRHGTVGRDMQLDAQLDTKRVGNRPELADRDVASSGL